MVLGKSLYGNNGALLLRRDSVLKQGYIDALQEMGFPGIYIDDEFSKGINIREVIDPEMRNNAIVAVQELFSETKFSEQKRAMRMARQIENIVKNIVAQILSSRDSVMNIAFLKTFDNYTYQHCVDVGVLSIMLGMELRMKRSTLVQLGKAALFHDIGKIMVPKNILNKPGRLTPEEFDEMKEHTQYGYDCLKHNLKQSKSIYNSALYHHEKFGGTGYPYGIQGDQIPFFAKIIAIADVYDALISKRVYKDGMVPSEAYEYVMNNGGEHFDPIIVNTFVRKIPPYPVGTSVVLSDGRNALVVKNRQSFMLRPLVKVITEASTNKYIDLAMDVDARSITIVGMK